MRRETWYLLRLGVLERAELLLGCVALSFAGLALHGQHMDEGARRMLKSSDTAFALKAAQGGLAEVKLGRIAVQKAGSPDVKAFGHQMVDDHTKANERLKLIASEELMTLPDDINLGQQTMYDKVSKLSDAEFDKEYVKGMLSDHEEAVKDFKKEASEGTDQKLKSFASETLPVLQGHLEKIKNIQSKLAAGSSL